MAATFNAITGCKRRAARRDLPRKKRSSQSSTITTRMNAEKINEEFHFCMASSKMLLFYLHVLGEHYNGDDGMYDMATLIVIGICYHMNAAILLLECDAELMDLQEEDLDNSGYCTPCVDVTFESFVNDDECEAKTRFTKGAITTIIGALNQPNIVRIYFHPTQGRYYKFMMESLVIYMLRKMSTARTHCDLVDSEFGGCSKRWAFGYKWILHLFDTTFAHLIGPTALEVWAPHFPYFAEKIRQYIQRDKERTDRNGNPVMLGMPLQHIGPGEFNIFSAIDCTVYEICRPGSGPANNNNGAGRRQNWYIKQRAFYDGYHRAFQACLKILTIILTNGITAAVYGPTSGRQSDRKLLRWADFDDYLKELCEQHHNSTLYCTYGDDIFAGYWYCVRTKHKSTGDMPLTPIQEEENENMKSVREMVEWSYAKAEQNWPMLNRKNGYKLEQDPDRVWAEIRVMYLLTNFKVCELEGSTMTGTRGFECPPPTLAEYLAMQ